MQEMISQVNQDKGKKTPPGTSVSKTDKSSAGQVEQWSSC